MIDINELRRLAQAATPGPWRVDEVGAGFEIAAGDNVIAQAQSIPRDSIQHAARRANAAFIAAANPAAITELLDRLEAAESTLRDDYQNWMTALDRNAELLAKLEAAEKTNREWLRANAPGGWIDNLRIENDALRAKIAEMGRQKPAYWGPKHAIEGGSTTVIVGKFRVNPTDAPLYTLPGAQPAPSVPMDVIADYLVSISAHIAHQDDAKAQAEIGELLKMIAAAPKPEAKPCP